MPTQSVVNDREVKAKPKRALSLPFLGALLTCLIMPAVGCSQQATTPSVPEDEQGVPSTDSDAADANEAQEVLAWVGTNPTGIRDIEGFEPLEDGDELEIEMGFQGAWMVVLALKMVPQLEGMSTLRSSLYVEDELVAYFEVKRQFLVPANDGFEYYLNIFLIVPSADYVGKPGRVVLEAFEHLKEDTLVRADSAVSLIGGIVPDELPPPPDF